MRSRDNLGSSARLCRGLLIALIGLATSACPNGDEDSPTSATDSAETSGATDPTDGDGDPSVTDGTTSDTDPSSETTGAPNTTATTDADTSSTTAAPTTCGDGQLDPVEECDWGMGNSEEAGCTPGCELAKCGDGYVQLGVEECDEGLDNDNNGACTHECLKARSGDGHTQLGVEECDDGDTPTEDDPVINDDDAYGGCTTQCLKGPRCGDGIVQPEEECDDGEEPDPAVCTQECTSVSRVIFVTSIRYDGGLGGPEGADQLCQKLATQGGRANPETFRAWLSGDGATPLDWQVNKTMRYQLPTGTIVADDWDALTSGQLKVSINQTETEMPLGNGDNASVWTGTLADGSAAPWTCNGWTDDTSNLGGRAGWATLHDEGWTDTIDQKCSSLARLYCVEVW
ncbi:MAG: DUF4215 domain-containing protein [Nannocystaceae bacterium]